MTLDPAVGCLIVACAGLLFLMAAIHKLRDRRRFGEIFAAYGVLPRTLGRRVAPVVPLLELAVAGGLLFDGLRARALCVGSVLLVTYATVIAINLARGRRDLACGCGGPDDHRPIAVWMVWRNISMAILLATALLPWTEREFVLTDAATVGFGTAACALIYLCLDRLSAQAARVNLLLRTH